MLLSIGAATLQAQSIPEEGTVGLTASLQGQGVDILVPYWASENVVIAPQFGFQSVENSQTRIRLGVKPKFYRLLGNNFASYLSAMVVFEQFDPTVGDSEGILNLGGGFGGEYFFSSHFSLGVEALLNLRLSDQNSFGTGAAFTGSFYF